MRRSVALLALALWALVGGAHAQEPVPFDYRCDAAAATTTPAGLPADGWLRAEDGKLPRAAGSPCWLRIDVARLAPRVLSVGHFKYRNQEVAVFSRDGRPLAFARRAGPRDQVLFGNDDGALRGMLFPTLLAEDGPVLMRVQRIGDITLTAVDLVRAVQAEQNFVFGHLGVGVFYVIVTLVAALLGVLGRDRGQFVFAALFAWLALALTGYSADLASNGVEAIEAIERQPYDLVLMDVQMPELDGLEASRRIVARWPEGRRPRIVAMTANATQGDREMCIAAGMEAT